MLGHARSMDARVAMLEVVNSTVCSNIVTNQIDWFVYTYIWVL